MTTPDVVHLSSAHRPLDPRIHHRECRSLVQAGYRVTQIAPAEDETNVAGVCIRPVKPARTRLERMTRTLAAVYRAARAERAAIYHFHDPELIPVGLLLRARGARVIYDVHEDLPVQILDKHWLPSKLLRRSIARALAPVEEGAGARLDGIVAASSEIAERFPPDRTVLVRNFVKLEMVDAAEPRRNSAERPVAIYPGSLSPARGIREIITAMEVLDGRMELWLLGKWASAELERACKRLPGWEHTRYFGQRPLDEVYRYMKAADIGLHMPYAIGSYTSGLAMKGFEYMASGLPMVMTEEPAKRETFGECALFADARDPSSIAERLRSLLDNPEAARRLASRGRELVEEHYSWERESTKLLSLYQRIHPGVR